MLKELKTSYMKNLGLTEKTPKTLKHVNLARLGTFVDRQTHCPTLEILESYKSFKHELLSQYRLLLDVGVKFKYTTKDPYTTFSQLKKDYTKGETIRIFSEGEELPKNHPLAEISTLGISYNLIFRSVHDFFGHLTVDADFSFMGEYLSYKSHASMFSNVAQNALACETVLQSIWVEHGPHKYINGKFLGSKSAENALLDDISFQPQKIYPIPSNILNIL